MKHLVIIGLVVPEPASTAAGSRMLQLIEIFRQNNYKITFLSSASHSEFSEKINVTKIELNDDSFDDLIKELQPDIVLFDRFVTEEQFGWRVLENCPNVLKILDTEDLHFLREARRTAFNEKRKIEENDYFNSVFKREIASILRCDLSLIISEFEFELLTEKLNINPETLFYIPFLADDFSRNNPDFASRKHFASIGNFLHEPNWQTVLLLKKFWKNIRKQLPDTEIHIYGAYPSEKVFQLHNEKEGFIIKGRADSAERIFKEYRVLSAPIPFGAGLKGKLFESMKYGIPNITTSVGAEGMTFNTLWNGKIADDETEFVQEAVALYQNETLWNECQKNGYEIIEQKFMKKDFDKKLLSAVETIENNLQQHRNRNFIGMILQHHSLQSTKYMSKWIEEKNKRIL
ncbi:MAG: glycosyltransferase [Bergeyella sp.]